MEAKGGRLPWEHLGASLVKEDFESKIMPSKVSKEAPEASQGLASQGNLTPYLNKLEPKSHLGSLSGTWSPKGNF